MRPRLLTLVVAAVLGSAAAPAAAQAPQPGERVAQGVSAGRVDLSGLAFEDAANRINAAFRGRLERAVRVEVAGRVFRLTAERARFEFDHVRTAKRALYAGRALPAGETIDVPLALGHSGREVNAFAARVGRSVRRAPRDAAARITLRRVTVRGSRSGRRIDHRALAGQVADALARPGATRILRPKLRTVRAGRTYAQVRRAHGTVITVDRRGFRLRLFKNLRVVRTYRVAVGQPAYPTPAGRFNVTSKQVNPNWYVPNSPWAGELGGSTVSGSDPSNPLKARWMGLAGGIGIHGTGEEGSIGSRASHGCIRMRVADVVALYRRVPLGTPVLIR